MSFRKFASLESAQVLDVKGTKERVKTASLDKVSDFHDYRTEDGYLYARIRAISSRVNKNHDGWPSVELAGGPDSFERHVASRKEASITVEADSSEEFGYSTFMGKPVFVDHHNSDPTRARGVIVDAKLHVEDHKTASELDSYYSSAPDNHMPPTWVELLLEVDANSFPKLAKAIVEGSKDSGKGIDGFSMGCDVEKTQCSVCSKYAHSPDEYCEHVRLKGAEFDHIDKTGKKIRKKAYEDCYGIKFFEISAVFDPADETALTRELIHKEAGGNYPAGADGPNAPWNRAEAPTVEQFECPECYGDLMEDGPDDAICRQCGNEVNLYELEEDRDAAAQDAHWDHMMDEQRMGKVASKTAEHPLPQSEMVHAPQEVDTLREESVCPVCGSHMDDDKCEICGHVEPPENFKNPDLEKAKEPEMPEPPAFADDEAPAAIAEPGLLEGRNPAPTASVRNDMAKWNISIHPKVAGRINPVERPITTSNEPATDEPKEDVVQDETKPVTSKVRTAKDFVAAVGHGKETQMAKEKVAAEPVPAAKPDKRVDVEGVGGYVDPTNEQGAAADKQVDVEGEGGTGVEDVSADQENVDVSKAVETEGSGPTKTYPNKNQADPVKGPAFPTEAAKKGTDPVDPVGKADDRVDLEQEVSVSWNQSDNGTDQWTGTGGNGVTKQQDPVTKDTIEGDNIINLRSNNVRSSAHIFAAFKLADLEVELGLTDADKKYDRAAELEAKEPEEVTASLEYAQRVKNAGLKRQVREAKRLPSFSAGVTAKETPQQQKASEEDDSALFF